MKRIAATPLLAAALLALPVLAQPLPIGPEFRVNSSTTGLQSMPRVAGSSLGFVVVWDGQGAMDADGIFAQRYDTNGTPSGSEFKVNTTTTGIQNVSAVASESSGQFVVAWVTPDGNGYGVAAQRFDAAGAKAGAQFSVNTYTTGAAGFPDVSMNPNSGDFVIVWRSSSQDGSGSGVYGQRYASSGPPAGTEFRVNADTTGFQEAPAVAMSRFGSFLVVWQGVGVSGGFGVIMGRRYDSSGQPQGGDFRVSTYAAASPSQPDVSVDSQDVYTVVWEDAARETLFGQRFDGAGAPLGGEFRVSSHTGLATGAAVVSNAASSAIAVWGSAGEVFGQRLAPDEKGPFFRANLETAGSQVHPDIGRISSRRFVVVWGADVPGDTSGVAARVFCLPKGDANFDGTIDILDVFYLINALFAAGPAPLDSGDANGDNLTTVLDVFHLINYLFAGGPQPSCG
jgi:hypothetical protein